MAVFFTEKPQKGKRYKLTDVISESERFVILLGAKMKNGVIWLTFRADDGSEFDAELLGSID